MFISVYLSEKAEMKVEEALVEIMFGKPGLLLRGLISNRNTYHHLTKIVRDIPPLHGKGRLKKSVIFITLGSDPTPLDSKHVMYMY